MKILSIRIKNLASLAGEHFIDFESEPLASTGLIAIIGKTGAGKSTILDAMCLALFNRIPRLKDSDGKIKDADGSEIPTTAPQTVLRKGASHGLAEVQFLAQDQKIYHAKWELKRAKDKTDGKLQKIQRALICVTDENKVLAHSAIQMEKELRQITHLTFEQFTRAVLLAQSEVTAFLKARDAERGELLEYLTNSNIFGKIGELAFRKTAEISKQRKEIEQVIGHIHLLSDEEISALHTAQQHTAQLCQQLEQQLQELNTQQQWFARQNELQDNITTREQHYQTALTEYQQLESAKHDLQQLDRFAEIRAVVQHQQELSRQQQPLLVQLETSEQNFQQAQQQFKHQQEIKNKADQHFTQAQAFAQKHAKTLQLIREGVQKRLSYCEQYQQQKSELEQLQNQYTPLNHQIQQQEQQLLQLQQQHEQLKNQLDQQPFNGQFDKGLETHISHLEHFIQQYQALSAQYGHFSQLEAQLKQHQQQYAQLLQQHGDENQIEQRIQTSQTVKEQTLQQRYQIDVIGEQLQKYLDQQQRLAPLQQNLESLQHQQLQMHQQVQHAEQQWLDAQTARQQLQQLLQQQRLIHAENVKKLRQLLAPEQPCMVCGSTHHPYVQNQDAISKGIFELQQQQEQQAFEHEKTCLNHLNHHKDLLQKHQLQLAQLEKEATLLAQHIEQMRSELSQQIKIANINIDLEQSSNGLLQQFSDTQKTVQQQLKQLDQQLEQLSAIQKQQQQLAQQQQQLQDAHRQMQQLHGQIHLILDALSTEQKQHWQTNPLQMCQQLLSTLQARLSLLNQFEQHCTQLNQQQQDYQTQKIHANHLRDHIDKAQHKLTDITQQAQQNNHTTLTLIQGIATIASDQQSHEWLAQYDADLQEIQLTYQQAQQQFEQQRTQFDAEQQQLNLLKSQVEQLAQQLQQATQQIDLWLSHNSDFNPDLINRFHQMSHADVQNLRHRIQQTELSYQNAVSALNTMREELAKHQQLAPLINFSALQQQLIEKQHSFSQAKQHFDELKLQLQMHQQELTKQQKFADQIAQIKQEEQRWHKISSVMGDATGKKFRDYAQQYHLDILLEYANQQLQQLSQRYTLKRLENSLSLAIIDHDMDGEVRSVASLSGGESFLTALALSLAIANMASGDLKIESLFIDEGFGTLDPASLHMVMNALDHLQSQGRKVVLISHVQEMHERIPVQIQVKPIGAGASKLIIQG